MNKQIQDMIEEQQESFTLPVDPATPFMKYFGVPKGVSAVISVEGSRDILEVINPSDGRPPFFRLREEMRVSEDIELNIAQEDDYEQSPEV